MSGLPWEAPYRRGIAALAAGDGPRASAELREALRLAERPSDAAAVCNDLATAYARSGEHAEAIALLRRGAGLHPENGRLWVNLANCEAAVGRMDEAIAAARRAAECSLEAEPSRRALRFLQRAGAYTDAAESYRLQIERSGGSAALWTELGTALHACGRIAEGEEAYLQALAIDADFAPALSNRLFALHLDDSAPPEFIADEHFAWGRRTAAAIRPSFDFHARDRSPERPLRIGVLSSDLRAHSIVHFLAPVLENLPAAEFPLTIFSNVASPDETTERLKAGTQRWRAIDQLSARESAESIYRDEIDILLEVGGHTSPKTLEVLAWKPAPIQIAYLAYPDTTGLATVDYVLTDAVADPPGASEHLYSERLLRLDPSCLCYRPPEATPPFQPRDEAAPVVFGSFAQRQKLSPRTLSLWVSILRRCPDSRLLLKAKAWTDSRLRAEILDWFAAHGVEPARIDLVAHIRSTRDHLNLYHSVDICLDTYPYSGITTTCEALWMGVPVIALPGRNQVSRLCASVLRAACLPELVAGGDTEYVEKALHLASAISRLRRDRAAFRRRLQDSPLFDERAFTAKLERAFRGIWREYTTA